MRPWLSVAVAILGVGCTSFDDPSPPVPSCAPEIEEGDPFGHPDVFGARASGEARAGRIANIASFPQPAHERNPFLEGDFVMANERIAVVIEGVRDDARPSDGYARFGGELVGLDRVGDDGRPLGTSFYHETITGIGIASVDPDTVTVLNDGSDGGAAIIRSHGRLRNTPFLDGPLGALLPSDFDQEAAFDYVLEPGAEAVTFRVTIRNETETTIDLGAISGVTKELFGFFQQNRQQQVTPAIGFGSEGETDWVGHVSEGTGFAWRAVDGPLLTSIAVSGFALFEGPGFAVDPCSATAIERAEIIVGGPYYDGLRAAVRRHDGMPEGTLVNGQVQDATGSSIADAWIHVLDDDGGYQSRVRADGDGAFSLRLVAPATLEVQRGGYRFSPRTIAPEDGPVTLTADPTGTLTVNVTDGDGRPIPARVQVIPDEAPPSFPDNYGVPVEVRGRLHQAFTAGGPTLGTVSLPVTVGTHRVVVSRGYEYELSDQTIDVASGETASLDVQLERSVDSAGVMCADFHIHTYFSPDSRDELNRKVVGAVADGLDIPCSSEHDWVANFGPIVEDLGLQDWAFGMSSSELTTFTWGHFGVIPIRPRPGSLNNGAVEWVGQSPQEVFAAVDGLEEAPALVVNHPRGLAIQGYFSAARLDNETGRSNDPLWSDNFDAVEVFNDSDFDDNRDEVVRDWFALLRAGRRVTAVGNSDSHSMRTSPVGYPRTCFTFGTDDPRQLTDLAVRDALLSGDSVVAGGLMLTVTGPDGARPGATLVSGEATFEVGIQAPSWIEADSLEVIVSGVTVEEIVLTDEGTGPGRRYAATVELTLDAGDVVVFHARGAGDLAPLHPGRRPFAVSNPFYVAGALRAADFAARRAAAIPSRRARPARPHHDHHHHLH
ncbi:MAG: CehA/McbA family metallohydrolase [Myxococcota bacterium]